MSLPVMGIWQSISLNHGNVPHLGQLETPRPGRQRRKTRQGVSIREARTRNERSRRSPQGVAQDNRRQF